VGTKRSAALRLLRTALGNEHLRRLLAGWLATGLATWAFGILLLLYAYAEGGTAAVGVAVLVRMLPAALAAPSVALLADRRSRRAVLTASAGIRAALTALVAGAVAADVPLAAVLALAAALNVAETAHRPAQAALLSQLARTPAELAAGNVAWSASDNVAFLAGSLAAGVLAGAAGLEAGFAACVVPYLMATVLLARLPRDRPAPADEPLEAGGMAELLAGFRTVAGDRDLRLLTTVFTLDAFVQAVADVLLVVLAIELLDVGDAGLGWLNAAWGVGGLVGGAAAMGLLGRRRLAPGTVAGLVVSGAAFAAVVAWPVPAAALALLVAVGAGHALTEVGLLTLTQRLAADDVVARVFGVQETTYVAGTALGSVVAAGLVGAAGLEAAVVLTGLVLPVTALFAWRRLGGLESGVVVPERAYALLRRLPLFAPLPAATVETLATRSASEDRPAGEDILRQGDEGDRFFVVDAGEVEFLAGDRLLSRGGEGACFGEIALLRDVPRTATVRAVTPVRLVALDRSDFLAGVSAHPRSTRAAERLADQRLRHG
jgi:MFS family permease